MRAFSESQIRQVLSGFIDPYLNTDLISTGALKGVKIEGEHVTLEVKLSYPAKQWQTQLATLLAQFLENSLEIKQLTCQISWQVAAHAGRSGLKPVNNVKNILAVASGKGGVGKSTTAVNLALALAQEGANVGILDADIYGPNQPQLLGTTLEKPTANEKGLLQPIRCHGLQSISMGYLVDVNAPIAWRGPMVSTALQQLLYDTQWDDLDYLIIDLPPGTGDVQLTLAQKIPVSGAVVVTTPQDIALADVNRAIAMFEKVSVLVLGIVENMSMHICSNCGHAEAIFGKGGGAQVAKQFSVPVLGQVPLDATICQTSDQGTPVVVSQPHSVIAQCYRDIALKSAALLNQVASRDVYKFPKIVIENN